jgi:hypothetical protein
MKYWKPILHVYSALTTINTPQTKVPGNPDGMISGDPNVTGPSYECDEI